MICRPPVWHGMAGEGKATRMFPANGIQCDPDPARAKDGTTTQRPRSDQREVHQVTKHGDSNSRPLAQLMVSATELYSVG